MPHEGRMLAAVDLGSNSFHMIVARQDHGQLLVIDSLREMVRLAAGLDDRKNLDADAKQRALECLARFGQRLRGIPGPRIRAVATNTLRRMRDPRAFLGEAEAALGHPIEVISGHEEARLIYLGVAQGLATSPGRRLVIDIGGGSTECIIGRGNAPETLESVSVGCVGLSLRHFPDGKLSRSSLEAAATAAALELRPIRRRLRRVGWSEVVGSSGTIRAVAKVLRETGWSEEGITAVGLEELWRLLREAGDIWSLELPGLSDDRRPVFAGGVAILIACLRNLEIDEMLVSDAALREGTLHDLVGRIEHHDPRDASVAALASRCRVDMDQAARVRATATEAFDQVAARWVLESDLRRQLVWAVQLHEIGLSIAHSDHHRHGAYLAQHSTLNGFSREEQLVVATLILGHRRKLGREVLDALPDRLHRSVLLGCAILRLSVLLHRSRMPDSIPPFHWEAEDDALRLEIPDSWLAAHPLTREDLLQERDHLRRVGLSLRFE